MSIRAEPDRGMTALRACWTGAKRARPPALAGVIASPEAASGSQANSTRVVESNSGVSQVIHSFTVSPGGAGRTFVRTSEPERNPRSPRSRGDGVNGPWRTSRSTTRPTQPAPSNERHRTGKAGFRSAIAEQSGPRTDASRDLMPILRSTRRLDDRPLLRMLRPGHPPKGCAPNGPRARSRCSRRPRARRAVRRSRGETTR